MIHWSWIIAGFVFGAWYGILLVLHTTTKREKVEKGISMNLETKLQNQIIVALCENGCVARNHTVGQFYTKYGTIVNVGREGESDIFGHRISDGKALYIEVKLPGEEPRKDQQRFIDAMKAAGAIAGCAHSVEEALNIVRSV